MTLFASQGGVNTGQREITIVMIKVDMIPTGGVVTGCTVCAKFSSVIIISLMTRIAIQGHAFELLIDVARLTKDFRMPAV